MKIENRLEVARKYIGTPFHPGGRLLNVGVDCVGLIACIAQECNIPLVDMEGYNQTPANGLFEEMVCSQLDKITMEELQAGDLLIFKFLKEPQHIAFVSEINDNSIKIIHAFSQVNKVVEHDLDKVWQRRLKGPNCGAYRFKNIE